MTPNTYPIGFNWRFAIVDYANRMITMNFFMAKGFANPEERPREVGIKEGKVRV